MAVRSSATSCGSLPTCASTQTIAPVPGAFANLYAGDATKWTYAKNPDVATRSADSRNIYSSPAHRSGDTAKPRLVFARVSVPLFGVDADAKRQRLPCPRCRIGSGSGTLTSSPETFPGYHHFPYNVTQATWSAPVTARLLLEAGYSRFQYLWAGFGQVPPDGITNLIPVQEQSAMYGQPNFIYRGAVRSAGLRLRRQRRQPEQLARDGLLRHRRPQHEVRLSGFVSEVRSRGGSPTRHSCEYRFNNGVPNAVSYYLAPRWEQNDRTEAHSLFAQDQWTKGRLTLQGGVRYDRAWSWAPADGNGTSLTSTIQSAADQLSAKPSA